MFQREDHTLFRSPGTLAQKAGVPARMLFPLVAKELADNALDVSGHCEYGRVGERGFFIADLGEGMSGTDADIASLFSIKRPLTSSKLLRLPTRGALGNGLRVVAGAVLATGGTLTVATRGRMLRLTPQDEGHTIAENIGGFAEEGTRITVHLGQAAGPVDLKWVRLAVLMASGGTGYKGATSPFWYDADAFFELTQAAGERSVRELIASFDGCTGKRAGEIAAPFKNRLARSLTRDEAANLLCAARQSAKPVNPERLGAVGAVHDLPASYFRVNGTHVIHDGAATAFAELPYVIEAWADFEEDGSNKEVHVCINRTPAIGEVASSLQKNCTKTELALKGCGLHHFVGSVGQKIPRLWLNITIPYMPIISDGKIPDLYPFLGDIKAVIEKAVGKAKRRTSAQGEKKISETDVILDYLDAGVEKASGDGEYRFSQRQLFYAVRDISKKADLSWKNFCKVLTGYESEYGDITGLYRDPRGILYHPHTHEEIPLGTLAVEKYARPLWTFNKVLYIEKEGFFAVLKDIGWPERNDCALLTSKGFASRAARDVIDLLGDSGEKVTFYCVHDADASGTLIYQSLQHATKARAARRVKIINLGLEPKEALAMGLQPEQYTKEELAERKNALPVAEYIKPEWREWLQTQRVELNAMSTPEFLDWLDSKFAQEVSKVVPPVAVLQEHLESEAEAYVREQITEALLQKGGFEERVAETMEQLTPALTARLETITEEVVEALHETPEHLWKAPVQEIAKEVAESLDFP